VIFELIQAGYPADYILQMTTRAINGVGEYVCLSCHLLQKGGGQHWPSFQSCPGSTALAT
jgi:hypothetical protein